MKIYHYHRETGELIGDSIARENPLEQGEYLIPAYATDVEPLAVGENEAAIFDEAIDSWTIVPDYRGQTFWDADRNKHEITELGVEPKDGWLTEELPLTEEELAEQFETKKENMISQLKNNANKVITSRFPEYHQINLLDGTKEDIPDGWDSTVRVSDYAVIKEFKQNIITANNDIESNITALSYLENSVDDLESIRISQDDIKIGAGY
ncbi:hypothetical protein [Halocella sp. SP3-1]|uniref:hypothetical protein n=1 Tax=Halocella sp. SP3-1 TaxID=2382161 RepID=UPI000F7565D8|nr:hypothetical protein [Halocella sp. SP3-1]AZO96079.1 hypothetical protein D7D81_16600 [Halocella sp. SP3-1]